MADPAVPGAGMAADIAEQPDGYAHLLAEGAPPIAEAAAQVARWAPRYVVFTARGTSDHAAHRPRCAVTFIGAFLGAAHDALRMHQLRQREPGKGQCDDGEHREERRE